MPPDNEPYNDPRRNLSRRLWRSEVPDADPLYRYSPSPALTGATYAIAPARADICTTAPAIPSPDAITDQQETI
jgi:hypothetical protein